MKKFVRSLLAAAAFAAGTATLVATAPTLAVAQTKEVPKGTKPVDKVDPKKPVDPKTDPKPGDAKGTVHIKADKSGKFRFSVHDENDKTLMMSATGYATEEEAEKMLSVAKAILMHSKVTKDAPKETPKDKSESK